MTRSGIDSERAGRTGGIGDGVRCDGASTDRLECDGARAGLT